MLYARRKGWAVDRVEVGLRYDDHIALELFLGGDLTPEQERRLREIAHRCPVHRALAGGVVIEHSAG